MYTYKVRIHPNNKQATKIKMTMNKCIECQNIIVDYLDDFLLKNIKIPSCLEVRKWFTLQKKIKDNETLKLREGLTKKEQREKHLDILFYDVSNDALKQTVKDTYNAYVRYFKKLGNRPTKHKYNSSKKSFYVNPIKIQFTDKKVKLEKISNSMKENRQILNWISLAERNRIPLNVTYYNPRIIYDGLYFYLTVGVDDNNYPKKKEISSQAKEDIIGIDMNISSIVVSNGDNYKNIVSTNKYKKLNKSFKRVQRSSSRKYEAHKKSKKRLSICKNFRKIKIKQRRMTIRMNNLRKDSYYKYIQSILSFKPNAIHIEDLNVKMMQQNKILSKYIQSTGIRTFLTLLKEQCDRCKIPIREVDRYYPSSKTCSKCGNIKKDLKLKDRIYKCDCCNNVMNRDLNAAINIAQYKFN